MTDRIRESRFPLQSFNWAIRASIRSAGDLSASAAGVFFGRRLVEVGAVLGVAHLLFLVVENGSASLVRPNVRVKPAPTAWRAGQQAQNGPQAQRLLAGVPRCWGSA